MMERALIEYVLNALWQVPLLAGSAWLLLRMVRPAPLTQHRVWLAVLGLAVLLPLHGMRRTDASANQLRVSVIEASREEALIPRALNDTPPARAPRFMFSPFFFARTTSIRLTPATAHWLFRFYVATIAIGLFRVAQAWCAARTLVENSQDISLCDRDRATLADYSFRLGIKQPQVRQSREVSSPMIVGVAAPVLLLPEGFARHTGNEIRAALCHELAHIQRQDYLLNVACQVAALPLAWHPVVDWVQQRIRMTREMVCDAMAAQEMKSQLGYAKCLLALAHSMLGGRGMAAQADFLGLFGNNSLEERVMRLMDTTTMSVRTKTARAASGAALMIATGVMAGMFHVAPTMAQANALPPAAQNPQADAQAPVPESKASSSPTATHGDTTPTTPKKRTYVHRNGGDGEGRESTLTEQRLIDKDVQQQMDDLRRQMAEVGPKVDSPEFKQQMDDLQKQMAEVRPKVNSPEFKQRMDDAQRQIAEAIATANSPEFQQRMDDLQKQMAEVAPKLNSPEFKQQMDDLRRQMAEVGPKVNSPEFKQQMEDLQREMQKQMEEFRQRSMPSPNP